MVCHYRILAKLADVQGHSHWVPQLESSSGEQVKIGMWYFGIDCGPGTSAGSTFLILGHTRLPALFVFLPQSVILLGTRRSVADWSWRDEGC